MASLLYEYRIVLKSTRTISDLFDTTFNSNWKREVVVWAIYRLVGVSLAPRQSYLLHSGTFSVFHWTRPSRNTLLLVTWQGNHLLLYVVFFLAYFVMEMWAMWFYNLLVSSFYDLFRSNESKLLLFWFSCYCEELSDPQK